MKKHVSLLWIAVFAGLCLFFHSFGTATFVRQEEVQLFIPEWNVILGMLTEVGGFCTVVGQALTACYVVPVAVVFINSALLCAVGVLCYLLLQRVAPRGYNMLLALFPVLMLLKAHLSPFYVIDGTVAVVLLLPFSYIYVRIRRVSVRMVYGVISAALLYGLAGQMAALYGIAVVVLSLLCRERRWYASLAVMIVGLELTYAGIRMATCVPLTDGIYSERYQEAQLQPDSYIYYVWLRFAAVLAALFVMAFVMQRIPFRRWAKVITICSLLALLSGFTSFCMPGEYEVRNNGMNRLSILERQHDWDAILRELPEKTAMDHVSLSYVNMALARKGMLADRLFHYNQRGPQSLLAPWDRTYYMSCLLSDIHYMIGDIGFAEGYAMEGLTLAKRGGSPRMLQRLVEISLIRRDFALAGKYLGLLSRMPAYRHWAVKYAGYMHHPERISGDEELGTKALPEATGDSLLCLVSLDSLWMSHLHGEGTNRTTWEYLGCSYLLAKEMDKFAAFLSDSGGQEALPVHFQEAALVLAVKDLSILEKVTVSPEVMRRYRQFQKDIRKIRSGSDALQRLYGDYGDTFWFYYYCKKLEG